MIQSLILMALYAKRLGNHIHCMLIFTFFVKLLLKGFFFVIAKSPIRYK